jgi:hypothetical protein
LNSDDSTGITVLLRCFLNTNTNTQNDYENSVSLMWAGYANAVSEDPNGTFVSGQHSPSPSCIYTNFNVDFTLNGGGTIYFMAHDRGSGAGIYNDSTYTNLTIEQIAPTTQIVQL